MDILQAWDILNKHCYFVRPYYNNEGKIITFENEFYTSTYIFPFKSDIGEVVWVAEHGSFSLDDNAFYHNYKHDIVANSYEEVIIALAEWVVDNFGEDDYMDYFISSDNIEEMFEREGDYWVYKSDKSKVYWKEEELLARIREFEKEGGK